MILTGTQTVSTLIGLVLPLLVGLLSTRAWPGQVKALLLAALSFATAVATDVVDAWLSTGAVGSFDWRSVAVASATTWVTANVTHWSVWKKAGASDWVADRLVVEHPPAPPARGKDARELAAEYSTAEHDVATIIRRVTVERAAERRRSNEAGPDLPGPGDVGAGRRRST